MRKALVLTIGTEITCGEIVNTNAAWVSERLEESGIRVFSHLSVRDHVEEIARALAWERAGGYDIAIVTGGLGPTTDDITRAAMADFAGVELEFDEAVWQGLKGLHQARGLTMRETHRHQCYFPVGSERLPNPVGTALGFYQNLGGRPYFTLPGPPRELQGMWRQEVEPRVKRLFQNKDTRHWVRWTCLGAPESEVADLTDSVLEGQDIEVGYRAQVPYVKVKIYVDPKAEVVRRLDDALKPFVVARGEDDLADMLLSAWPADEFTLVDELTNGRVVSRLLGAKSHGKSDGNRAMPKLSFTESSRAPTNGIHVRSEGQELVIDIYLPAPAKTVQRRRTLAFKTDLHSERGQRSATEWVLWDVLGALRAKNNE